MSSAMRAAVIGVMVLTLGAGSLGQSAWGEITGSAHDFSSQAWAGGQVCIVCHAPHNSQAPWCRCGTGATTSTTFTLYGSPTFGAPASPPAPPRPA